MSLLCIVGFFALAATNLVAAEASPEFPEIVRTKYRDTQRIVSGWDARQGQFPYQLSIRMVNPAGTVTACGGSIIHPQWGFTSAHCTALQKTLVLRAGVTDLTQPELIFETSTWYNHPDFIEDMPHVVQLNDITLIDFERFLTFTDNVQAVKIQHSWDKSKDYSGEQMIATGWGATATGGSSTQILNWVYLQGVTFMECYVAYGFSSVVGETTVCAGPYNVTSQSVCSGDSGGPLVVFEDGEPVQIGITSFVSGWGCESPEPSGFVRPGYYHEWITEITGLNFDELNESSESVQVVSNEESQSSESVQVVSSEDSQSSESVQVVSSEDSQSSESVQVVSSEDSQSSESVQVVSSEDSQSSESVQVVSSEDSQSSESVQVVSSEDSQSSESVQVVSSEDSQSSESVQVVSSEDSQSSESVQVVSSEDSQSSESVQVVSSEDSQSSESVQVVSSEDSQSSESVQVVSNEDSQSSESVQVVSSEDSQSSESVQVVSNEDSQSSESVQVVSSEDSQSSESVQVVSSQESSEEFIPLINLISNIFVD